jgi:DNA-binding response OmpR family regulator
MTASGRVLVVDDNPATRYATGRILHAARYEVVEARTGQEALDAGDASVDLVVLDIGLPDIDGFEVCRKLRERETTSRTPVLHLSATYTSDLHRAEGLSAGANLYLTHPVEPVVLLGAVDTLLRTRRAEDEVRRSEAKFRAIFNTAPTGIALLNAQGCYIEVNPALCRLLGRPREQIVGQPGDAVVAVEHQEDVGRSVGSGRVARARATW